MHKGEGAKDPNTQGEGAQGPWRRGATGCWLSRQLLVLVDVEKIDLSIFYDLAPFVYSRYLQWVTKGDHSR